MYIFFRRENTLEKINYQHTSTRSNPLKSVIRLFLLNSGLKRKTLMDPKTKNTNDTHTSFLSVPKRKLT